MPKPLRQRLELEVCDELAALEVDFRVIEIAERAFDMSADMLAAHLSNMPRVQRRRVADVICDWLGRGGSLPRPRLEIREWIITAPAAKFYPLVGAIVAAMLYAQREMTEEEFKATAAELLAAQRKPPSTDADGEAADGDDEVKKKPAA